MSGSITRQALAVVAAVAMVCSVAGAPVAATATIDTDSDGGLSGLTADGQSVDGSGQNSTADSGDEDEGADDSEGDGGTDGDGTENGTDGTNSTDDGDESTDDANESSDDSSTSDSTLRSGDESDAESENGSVDPSTDDGTDRVKDTVNDTVAETTAEIENRSDDVQTADVLDLDVDNDTLSNVTAELVETVQLDDTLGLDVYELVEPLAADDGTVERTHTYDETVTTDRDATPTATESTPDGGADEETAATAVGGSDEEPDPADPAGAGAAMGLGALATAAALRGSPLLVGSKAASSSDWVSRLVDRIRPFVFPLRYSRYDDSDPLEHEARERVYEIVDETPGSYLSEVSEEAGLPLSTTRHHIRVLEREDLVTGAKLHGKRRFFPAYAEGKELAAALNDDSTASIIDAIARIGAASVSDLADELGRDPSTISHHLQRLEDDGVITRERDGRAVVSRLSAEARTALEPETAPETGEAGDIVASSAD